jgi:hypothetical protein
MFALLWQALAALLPAQIDQQSGRIAHAVVHAQEVGHHHDADSSLHGDDDVESPHQHAHDGVQPPGILTASSLLLADPGPAVRRDGVVRPPRAVFLDAPLRPPRQITRSPRHV